MEPVLVTVPLLECVSRILTDVVNVGFTDADVVVLCDSVLEALGDCEPVTDLVI